MIRSQDWVDRCRCRHQRLLVCHHADGSFDLAGRAACQVSFLVSPFGPLREGQIEGTSVIGTAVCTRRRCRLLRRDRTANCELAP